MVQLRIPRYGESFLSVIIVNYLTDKIFLVEMINEMFEVGYCTIGVPQGSILGPFLCNVYTADPSLSIRNNVHTYTDNTIITYSGSDEETSLKLQNVIQNIINWKKEKGIKIHTSKSTQCSSY